MVKLDEWKTLTNDLGAQVIDRRHVVRCGV